MMLLCLQALSLHDANACLKISEGSVGPLGSHCQYVLAWIRMPLPVQVVDGELPWSSRFALALMHRKVWVSLERNAISICLI